MQISESIKNRNFKNCLENLLIKRSAQETWAKIWPQQNNENTSSEYGLSLLILFWNDSMSVSAKISTVVLYLYLSNVVNWVDRNNL